MLQEQDTCRICSGPGEDEQPLFYPCKCSGTIRYIHQDCLKTWLDHSKKTTCDVCKHPYSFTKVYAPDMPDRVPVTILIRKFAEQVAAVIFFLLRATLVAFVWLTLLPYGTVLTWRLYFRMGDVLAWGISLHNRSDSFNTTLRTTSNHTIHAVFLSDVSLQTYLRSLSADIFTGQIIASLIVLAFLAVFLLREWIQQNALPGVFDDVPAGEMPAPAQAEERPQEEPNQVNNDIDQGVEAPEEVAEPTINPGPDLEIVPAPGPVPDIPEDVRTASPVSSSSSSSSGPEDSIVRPAYERGVRQELPATFGRRRRIRSHQIPSKVAHRAAMEDIRRRRWTLEERGPSGHFDVRSESPLPEKEGILSSGAQVDEKYVPQWDSELYAIESGEIMSEYAREEAEDGLSTLGQKRKAEDSESERTGKQRVTSRERSLSPQPAGFEFTFSPPTSSPGPSKFPSTFALPENGEFKLKIGPSVKTPASPDVAENLSDPVSSRRNVPRSESQVFELPPLENRETLNQLPYPLNPRSFTPASTSELLLPEQRDIASAPSLSSTLPSPSATPSFPQLPKRPTLPMALVSPAERPNADASSSAVTTDAIPLPSPHLAIYRPPEELEMDADGYFNGVARENSPLQEAEQDEQEELEDDASFEYYFREPELGDTKDPPPPLLLPDTDDEDENEDDAHGVEEPRELDPHEDADEANAAQDVPGPDGEVAENADEDRDQNLEEDLDGAMEAVGLRGPVSAVFQNAALMLFILNVSIGGGIWIPFTLGKTVALLTLEPRRALQILHLPIRAVRLVTDPSVDGVIWLLRFTGTFLLHWSKFISLLLLRSASLICGEATQDELSRMWRRIHLHPVLDFFMHSDYKNELVSSRSHSALRYMPGEQILSFARSVMFQNSRISSLAAAFSGGPTFQLAEENFAGLGRYVRVSTTAAWKAWIDIAEGDGTVERITAIFLGYAIAAFLAALYLNTFTVGNVKSAGRAVRSAIRQQMIVLKVALFIVVELVMFPFGCGTMLDFSTLSLFPEATVESRMGFFTYAPITAAFYHWLIGTMFMYQFAILLATCREILRPGCMWFIKDPQDPTFHPIRDILDRPTLAQLRKLFMSAVMYAFVITLGVGCIVWCLTVITPSILPLRWKMREPLWDIPVDLLFVHLILPPTLHYFRPRKAVRRLMTAWWRWSARQFRLTSFMFGDRHPQEEYTPTHWSWSSLFFDSKTESVDTEAVRDGGFRRVPAGDNIAFLRDKPALVQVDEHGVPVNDNAKSIMSAQNAEAQQAGRNYKDDYTIVYVPPHFPRRILSFIAFFWLSGSVAMMSALFAPILLGRAIFGLFTSRHVHDGYSFAVGFYILWWSWLVGILMVRIRVRRQRHSGSRRIRAGWFLFLFKRVFVYFTKVVWMGFWLGIVLPTLVSIAVDLYVVIPLRYFINPSFTPTIHVVESWTTGLIISKIIIRTQRTRPGADLTGALEAIQRNGWRRPDPFAATRDFIIPVGTGLVGMISLPPLALYGLDKFFVRPWPMEDLVRLVYPSIFVAVGAFQFAMSLVGVFKRWTQGIRDKEFLVELRLRNLDNPRKPDKAEMTEVESSVKIEEGA